MEIEQLGRFLAEANAEHSEVRELESILRRKGPAPRRSFWQSLQVATHRLLLFCVGSVRFVVDVILGLLTLVFLAIWGLKLPHPPKWDTWWVVKLIHDIGGPVLAQIDAVLEWPEAVPYYPFMLVFLLSVGRVIVDSRLARIQRDLRQRALSAIGNRYGQGAVTWRLEQDARKRH